MAMKLEALAGTANEIRRDVIKSITAAKSGHPGGSLSAVDILTALYFSEMRIDPANPQDEDRDMWRLHCMSYWHAGDIFLRSC